MSTTSPIYNITTGSLSPLSPSHFNITTNGTIHLPGGITYGRLVTVGSDYRLARAFWVASLVVAVWDFLLTFGDEVQYVWKGRLTRTRVLFLVNRYWPIANLIFDNVCLSLKHPTDDFCFFFYQWFVYSPFVTHLTIGLTLILRIYAMYDCKKPVLYTLLTLLGVELVSETILVGFIGARLQTAHLPPPITGCIPRHIVPWVWAYWLPMTFFESTLFLLALLKAFSLAYHKRRGGRGSGRAPNVLLVLLRDSLIYFGGVLAVILTNFVVWLRGRASLFSTFPGMVLAVHSILGCRMLLNIQKAVYDQTRHESAMEMFTTLDTMNFTSGPSAGSGSSSSPTARTRSSGRRKEWEAEEEWDLDTYTVGFEYPPLTESTGTGTGSSEEDQGGVREMRRRDEEAGDEEEELTRMGGDAAERTRTVSFPVVGQG